MSNLLSWSNLKELLFPILNDLKNINDETSTSYISSNNLDLVNGDSDFNYKDVIEKIEASRKEDSLNHTVIIMK